MIAEKERREGIEFTECLLYVRRGARHFPVIFSFNLHETPMRNYYSHFVSKELSLKISYILAFTEISYHF